MNILNRSKLYLESLDERVVPSATILDLTSAGAVATAPNGAIVEQTNPQSTGSGPVNTFVRVNNRDDSTQQGYNTDARPLQFNDESHNPKVTHSIAFGDVPVVTVNGVSYLEFFLGVKQKGSSPNVSLDEVQIFLGNSNTLSHYRANKNTLDGVTPVFDLDSGGDVTVKLNADLSSGKGAWNMALLVPEAAFGSANPQSDVYLYSKFSEKSCGRERGGFEQWGIGTQSSPQGTSISGSVLVAGTTQGASGVTINLVGMDTQGNNVSLTTTTGTDGSFSFSNLAAGTYSIVQVLPQFQSLISETLGTVNGVADGNMDMGNVQFTNVTIAANQQAVGYVFSDGTQG